MIYLASPYSGTPAERMSRYHQALRFTEKHLLQGTPIFSPITYGHPFADTVGTSAAAWIAFNQDMLALCSELWVLTIPGWKTSKGVQQELATWDFLGKPKARFVVGD